MRTSVRIRLYFTDCDLLTLIILDMIIDQNPLTSRFISLPKELSGLCCNAFIAGIIGAVFKAADFPANVTAHLQPEPGSPARTVFLIRFDGIVVNREKKLALPTKK